MRFITQFSSICIIALAIVAVSAGYAPAIENNVGRAAGPEPTGIWPFTFAKADEE
ncbi:hypothetical protein CERSUDRAFT_93571 [Gelatoporia subvermispora B]|uniref:Uncharacterized protein n=1 Tax=Ceriporiopsis subvermispora (strain B) TaxID=914234 RepID=M2PNP3_CERS8|nr:hypothetical protein CERSUDRAFT_93571 [Gelatoporia subvermispora B]